MVSNSTHHMSNSTDTGNEGPPGVYMVEKSWLTGYSRKLRWLYVIAAIGGLCFIITIGLLADTVKKHTVDVVEAEAEVEILKEELQDKTDDLLAAALIVEEQESFLEDTDNFIDPHLIDCYKSEAATESYAKLNKLGKTLIRCDATTPGGPWAIIQRRTNGEVDFYRYWADYKTGFGDRHGDFWLGLDNIHMLTMFHVALRVDLWHDGEYRYAEYNYFSVADESENYAITVHQYHGDAGDALDEHHTMAFTTRDRDNDNWNTEDFDYNCAIHRTGAWWYDNCGESNLNGVFGATGAKGPRWGTLDWNQPAQIVEMKIRLREEP